MEFLSCRLSKTRLSGGLQTLLHEELMIKSSPTLKAWCKPTVNQLWRMPWTSLKNQIH